MYTAEDIFEHARTVWPRDENIESVFQLMIDLEDDTDEHVNLAMWNEIRSVRGSVNQVLENARRSQEIGSSLECAMSLRFEDSDTLSIQNDFAGHLDGAADIFAVSQTQVVGGDGSKLFSSFLDANENVGDVLGVETVETSAGKAEITVTKASGSRRHLLNEPSPHDSENMRVFSMSWCCNIYIFT